jgi:serine/threonine-protein kinase
MADATKRMGDYEILATLGAGGMGRVYKVRNTITDRVEAMKILLPEIAGHEQVAERFNREIKVLAALRHQNIAGLLTALTIDNQLVMVMEYVEGLSMSSIIDGGPIPVRDCLKYLDQVLDALAYAHKQHVIHRDIKPANMMVTKEGVVKLMDFGIARSNTEPKKLTATGSTLGSLSYMSPEQVQGKPTDERSDLYSLGISFYEMVTGTKPFKGDSDFSIMAAQINQAPTRPMDLQPGLPQFVDTIIMKAIAKAPEQRFQTADEFRNAVKRAQELMKDEKTIVAGSIDFAPVTSAAARHSGATTVAMGSATMTQTPVTQSGAAVATAAATPAHAGAKTVVQPQAQPAQQVSPAVIQQQSSSGSRALWIGLGALIVVVVLIAAGLYVPRWVKASASGSTTTQQPMTATPAQPQPVATQTQPPPTQPAETQTTAPPPKKVAKNTGPSAAELAAQQKAAADAAAQQKAELDEIEKQIDGLTSRAASVNSTIDTMARQNEAQGYGLRGDIVSKQASMKLNLSKAQDAIEHNDAARAKRYADATTADLEALERFVGR